MTNITIGFSLHELAEAARFPTAKVRLEKTNLGTYTAKLYFLAAEIEAASAPSDIIIPALTVVKRMVLQSTGTELEAYEFQDTEYIYGIIKWMQARIKLYFANEVVIIAGKETVK